MSVFKNVQYLSFYNQIDKPSRISKTCGKHDELFKIKTERCMCSPLHLDPVTQ